MIDKKYVFLTKARKVHSFWFSYYKHKSNMFRLYFSNGINNKTFQTR